MQRIVSFKRMLCYFHSFAYKEAAFTLLPMIGDKKVICSAALWAYLEHILGEYYLGNTNHWFRETD